MLRVCNDFKFCSFQKPAVSPQHFQLAFILKLGEEAFQANNPPWSPLTFSLQLAIVGLPLNVC